jgi:hypothetical protein
MEEYGDRMMRLIAEAFADGIVISIPEPEGDAVLIDPPEGQEVFQISAMIPHLGLTHLSLKRPEQLVVKAVVVGSVQAPEGIVPPIAMPLPKKL